MDKIWLRNYPTFIEHDIDPSEYSSVCELFDQSCQRYAHNPAFANMGKSITFGQLQADAQSFAAYLQHTLGMKKGDRFAIQLPNVLQYPVALFGALKAGLTVVNVNPLYTADEMRHQLKDSGATSILILANFAHKLQACVADTDIQNIIITELGDCLGFPKKQIINSVIKYVKKMVPPYVLPRATSFQTAMATGRTSTFTPTTISPEDLAFLQYTGGTTGVSKGAMLTHRNIVANMLQIQALLKHYTQPTQEVVFTPLPLYHIFALTVNCIGMIQNGFLNVLITNPKDLKSLIKTYKSTRPTLVTGVNTLFNALLNNSEFQKADHSKLKFTIGGGMAVQQAVSEKWKTCVGHYICEGYGLTETSPCACINRLDGQVRLGTIGMPLPSTEIKIIDDAGNELPLNKPGEICIRGPQVMPGYWNRPDETALVLTQDGWLKTGDIATVDSDGYVKIVDRKKEMILVSGFNVYPNEIEDTLVKHPHILEAAAIGVPDERSGEAIKVFLVANSQKPSPEEVITFCKKHLTAYKCPKYVEFRTELPKSNVGKILRRLLKEA